MITKFKKSINRILSVTILGFGSWLVLDSVRDAVAKYIPLKGIFGFLVGIMLIVIAIRKLKLK